MADLQSQLFAVNDDNNPSPENTPLPKLEGENFWRLEGILWPRQSKQLHNTYYAFKNYSCEEVMKMKNLELF